MQKDNSSLLTNGRPQNILLYKRWPWHVLFWVGYLLFRFWPYYLTLTYYNNIYLEYMVLSELMFVAVTYFTIWLYGLLFKPKKYLPYFLIGAIAWAGYLVGRTAFQLYYLRNEPSFRAEFSDMYISNITSVFVYFLFITACKYFKDGYINQQFEAEKKKQQLIAEVSNLKSQIAPHFLFNTLNNLYGLSVEKSDKLPALMLQLSELLRHSIYEAEKPVVPLSGEIKVIESYIQLESIRLEDDLELEFNNRVPANTGLQIAPLILIVFIENAFKHARLVRMGPVNIQITTSLENKVFRLQVKNNYDNSVLPSAQGIGLRNVKRRLALLYPNDQHELNIDKGELFYAINLAIHLTELTTG